jgi:hypothetical protein
MNSKITKTTTAKTVTQKGASATLVEPVVTLDNANKIVEKKLQNQVVEIKKVNKTEQIAQPVQPVQLAQPVQPVQLAQNSGVQVKTSKQTKQAVQPIQPVQPVQPVQLAQTAGKVVVEKKDKKAKNTKQVKEAKKETIEVEAYDDLEEQLGSKLRYFKLFYNEQIQGRYCGKKPKQAANKAFSSIIKDLNKNEQNGGVNLDINFSIKECTRHSKHKEYRYVGKRLILEKPVKVKIANADGSIKEIEYKFHNKLQKAPKVAAQAVAQAAAQAVA